MAIQRSVTFASFSRLIKKWSSPYHATRLHCDPLDWIEEQDWSQVHPHEWPEMVVAAAAAGCSSLVSGLIQNGGSPVQPNHKGQVPLLTAAQCCSLATIQVLVERGAPLDTRAADGRTLLRAALGHTGISAWGGHYASTILWLLDQGQSATEPDLQGNTPLHHAAMVLNEDVHAALLSRGADWALPNQEGVCPADVLYAAFGLDDSPYPKWRERVVAIHADARARLEASTLSQALPGSSVPVRPPRL